ncbi:MAG: hypothetical protein RLZZ373_3182 [Pseudomonadota bacterium]|jgi:hypothetical protein
MANKDHTMQRKQIFFHPAQGGITPQELAAAFPGVTVSASDDELSAAGLERLVQTERPACGEFQRIEEGDPVRREDGRIHRVYTVREMFEPIEGHDGNAITVEMQQSDHRAAILAQRKAEAVAAVAADRIAALQAGVIATVPGFGADEFSLAPMDVASRTAMAAFIGAARIVFSRSRRHDLRPADVAKVHADIGAAVFAIESRAAALAAAISAAKSVDEIPRDLQVLPPAAGPTDQAS